MLYKRVKFIVIIISVIISLFLLIGCQIETISSTGTPPPLEMPSDINVENVISTQVSIPVYDGNPLYDSGAVSNLICYVDSEFQNLKYYIDINEENGYKKEKESERQHHMSIEEYNELYGDFKSKYIDNADKYTDADEKSQFNTMFKLYDFVCNTVLWQTGIEYILCDYSKLGLTSDERSEQGRELDAKRDKIVEAYNELHAIYNELYAN